MQIDPETADTTKEDCAPKTGIFITLLCLCLAAIYLFLFSFQGFASPDAMKYADVTRNFLKGQGMISNHISPLGIIKNRYDTRIPAQYLRPNFRQYWGFPLILSVPFLIFGNSEAVDVIVCLMIWIIAGLLLYYLTAKLYSYRAAVLAAILYSLQGVWGEYGIAGISEPLCAALILGMAALVLAKRYPIPAAIAAGILGGFSLSVRQQMLFVAPIALFGFILLRQKHRLRTAFFLFGGMYLFIFARGAYYPMLFPEVEPFQGNPIVSEDFHKKTEVDSEQKELSITFSLLKKYFGFGPLMFSDELPGHAYDRSVDYPTYSEKRIIDGMLSKLPTNLYLLFTSLFFKMGNPFLILFFIFFLFIDFRDKNTFFLGATIIGLILATAVVCIIMFVMARYFHLYIPLILILVAAGLDKAFHWTKNFSPKVRGIVLVAAILLLTYPWIFADLPGKIISAGANGGIHRHIPIFGRFVKDNTKPEEMVFSDMPWITAWHSDRPSIWLPLNPSDVERISKWVKADYLFLSLEDNQGFFVWRDWLRAYRDKQAGLPLGDWKLVAGMKGPNRPMFLFRRPDYGETGESK